MIITILVIIIACAAYWYLNTEGDPTCARPENASLKTDAECFFSPTYFQARQLFLQQIEKSIIIVIQLIEII